MQIRVLVVDDSAFMRMMIIKMLESDPDIKVAGTARNGSDAIRRIEQLSPDVVTMDIEMPELDGLSALKQIMEKSPVPVLMISSLSTRGADATVEALHSGAVDFIAKPDNTKSITSVGAELVAKVKLAAATQTRSPSTATSSPMSTVSSITPSVPHPESTNSAGGQVSQLLAIGTSTGGPQALDEVLKNFPQSFPCPVLIVQHMPPRFTRSLATRLNTECAIHVVEAVNNQVLENGTAYIAPGGFHMTVENKDGKYQIAINQDEKRNLHRPSVDVLFESLAHHRDIKRHLVLMTGMGSDGAQGMLAAKASGAHTIAEAESTCVVYGMPKSAVNLGCVDKILPLDRIGPEVVEMVYTEV